MNLNHIETILEGETTEELKNIDCWIHYADHGEENIPEYIEQHEERRKEAQAQALEYEIKYRDYKNLFKDDEELLY